MFDPKKYDTRMRDPEGKRKEPPVEEQRQVPQEARLRRRSRERFDEKRAEEPLPAVGKARGEQAALGRAGWDARAIRRDLVRARHAASDRSHRPGRRTSRSP